MNTDDCSVHVTCANSEGSYLCGACPPGYTGDGHTCTDVDECDSDPCDPLTACTNAEGSYACGACPGVDLHAYMADDLVRINDHPYPLIDELAPDRWAPLQTT